MTSTIAAQLSARLRAAPAAPLVTFYDDATGERIELSAVTFDNWVAKTAGLLQDDLDVGRADRVQLLLPPHWQTLVWAAAAWAVGAVVGVGQPSESTEVTAAVAGPDTLEDALAVNADSVVGLSLRPMGGRFTTALPAGVLDYAVEVPAHPDRLMVHDPPEPTDLGWEAAGTTSTLSGLVARAQTRADLLGIEAGDRLLIATDDPAAAITDALLVPLVVAGSAVLVRHEDPTTRETRISGERVTVTVPAG